TRTGGPWQMPRNGSSPRRPSRPDNSKLVENFHHCLRKCRKRGRKMTQAPAVIFKVSAESPQPAPAHGVRGKPARSSGKQPKAVRPAKGRVTGNGTRPATRGDGDVIELE